MIIDHLINLCNLLVIVFLAGFLLLVYTALVIVLFKPVIIYF
ncbi:MAG: hypothetical protein WCW02_04645 [Candidatus Buchananbacteria bacterium]